MAASETRHSYHSTGTHDALSSYAADMRKRMHYSLVAQAAADAADGQQPAADEPKAKYSHRERHRYDMLQDGHGAIGQLALLYAIFLTLFGFMYPLSNYVSVRPQLSWPLIGFYITLYCTAIAILLYFLLYVMSRPSHKLFVDGGASRAGELVRLQDTERPVGKVEFRIGRFAVSESCPNFKEDEQQQQQQQEVEMHEQQQQQQQQLLQKDNASGDALQEQPEPLHQQQKRQKQRQLELASSSSSSDMSGDVAGAGAAGYHATVTFDMQDLPQSSTDTISRQKAYMKRINSTLIQNAKELGVHEIQAYSVLSLQESHSPSFFLRIACFIFGGLKVAHDLLHIIDTATEIRHNCASPTAAGYLLQYFFSIAFTVLQTFFIFKYSKVSMNIYQRLSVFGFMHLMATNMCVWFQAILLETSHNAKKLHPPAAAAAAGNDSKLQHHHDSACSEEVFWRMGPYLFPFTIEYSLMSAFSCYVLYCNVGKFLDVILKKGLNVGKKCLRNRKKAQTSFSASCYKSDKGFFLGALQIIFGLVSSVYFIVYVNNGDKGSLVSKYIFLFTDVGLLTMNFLLCIIAYCKMRQLTLIRKMSTGPDSWLLGITLMGVLAFEMFQLFGATSESLPFMLLRIAKGVMCIVQSTFQVFLVLDGEKRRSLTSKALDEKPGREMIAALLLGNLALWIVYTLQVREINSLPNFNAAYFVIASEILSYLCSPLIIFFRFHSACCFVEVWRHSYGSKTSLQQHRKQQAHKDADAFSIGFRDSSASLMQQPKADAPV